MRILYCLTSLLVLGTVSIAADPPVKSPFRIPELRAVVPQAKPVQPTGGPLKLTKELRCVIDCDASAFVEAVPEGIVEIIEVAGPRKWSAKFVDSNGSEQDREFTGKFLYNVRPVSSGKVDILVIPQGVTERKDIRRLRLLVEAGDAPRPPPQPQPKPDKVDPPKPDLLTNPFGENAAFRVLFVVSREKAIPADQASALYGKDVENYLKSKGIRARFYAPNEDGSQDLPEFAKAMKLPRTSVPWVYVGKGRKGESVPCPENIEDMLKLLKKYGD